MDLGDVCLNRNASAGIPFEILHGWRDSHADSGVPTALPRLPQGGFPICQDRSLCGAKQVSVLETAGSRCPDNSYDNKIGDYEIKMAYYNKKYLSHIGTRRQKAWNDTEKRTY